MRHTFDYPLCMEIDDAIRADEIAYAVGMAAREGRVDVSVAQSARALANSLAWACPANTVPRGMEAYGA